MLSFAYSIAFLFALAIPAYGQTRIDAISTTFRWIGPNDKIVVERYDDPKVANVSCYMSRADTGGIKGGLGFAEDPSRFSIACRAVGPVAIPSGLRQSEVIGFSLASLFFKAFRIHRAVDAEKNVLVYTVVSTKLINGSPFNSISVVLEQYVALALPHFVQFMSCRRPSSRRDRASAAVGWPAGPAWPRCAARSCRRLRGPLRLDDLGVGGAAGQQLVVGAAIALPLLPSATGSVRALLSATTCVR